ncbi:hypothetical protein K2X96_01730 [Patescibacteria group bacterium]|nr:hypothetical protein [Patescibacteria group bacterium]
MFIIEVIPLGKTSTQSLSYFSHKTYERGALIQAPVRGKTVSAIVIGVTDAFTMKAALRAATFSLRKLPEQTGESGISRTLFETAERGARFHGTSINAVLYALLPREVREGTLPFLKYAEHNDSIPAHDSKPRIFVAPFEDRKVEYGRMVRGSFAAQRSIIFVVPTLEYISQFEDVLKKGIENHTVSLHGNLSPSALKKQYQILQEETHPLLIITTPGHAFTERSDVGTIVVEHERSGAYVGKTRPYLDYRFMLTEYARLRGTTILLADTVVRSEEIFMLETEKATPFYEQPKRLELPGTLSVLSLDTEETLEKAVFTLLTKKLEHALDEAMKQKKRVFLYCARRGLAPLVACIDCGMILRDPESGAPLALLRTMKSGIEERWLVSSVSGYRTRASDLCPHCGSWRLRERGIGIQHVYDELIKRYEKDSVILFDHQTAQTPKKAATLKNAFYSKKGSILLGTTLALPYLSKPVDMSAVVSMDSLRAIPSWRQQEEMFALLMSLREKTHGTVYLQTRTDDDVTEFAKKGALDTFYTQELTTRKDFFYPPYAVFIHLSWKEVSTAHSSTKQTLAELFAQYHISLYSALHSEESVLQCGLLRVPYDSWPHEDILAKLKTLPPSIRIMINPDKIV